MKDRTLEQIDACRPGTDDVHGPGLAALAECLAADERLRERYQRVQRTDAAVAAAVRDVAVPEDLEERLLLALKAAEQGDADPAALVRRAVQNQTSDRGDTVAGSQDRITRRRRRRLPGRLVAALSVVVSCGLLLTLLLQRGPSELNQDHVASKVRSIYLNEVVAANDWSTGTAPQDAASKRAIAYLAKPFRIPTGWRQLKIDGYAATAYQLPRTPRGRVTLFVINRKVTGLPDTPGRPRDTQGTCIGVWQSKECIYVLAVEGTEHQYNRVLPPPSFA